MAKYVCSVCGFVYGEAKGIPEANIILLHIVPDTISETML